MNSTVSQSHLNDLFITVAPSTTTHGNVYITSPGVSLAYTGQWATWS